MQGGCCRRPAARSTQCFAEVGVKVCSGVLVSTDRLGRGLRKFYEGQSDWNVTGGVKSR